MGDILAWERLNRLVNFHDRVIDYKTISNLLKGNPSLAVVYMDKYFTKISLERMKQLARKYGIDEIDTSYFKLNTIKRAWTMVNEKLDIPTLEYERAIEYCNLSEKKINYLTEKQAELAFSHLLFVSEKIIDNSSSLIYDDVQRAELETAATVNEKVSKTANPDSINESTLVSTLQVLQSSSKESVVNADSFGGLRKYLHVERAIQKDLENILIDLKQRDNPSLILLCGSVGDGKSHLLAYMKENYPDLLENVLVHNDSTESYEPDKNSLETLEKVLEPFELEGHADKHVIIAINLGVLQNFYSYQRKVGRFQGLCDFIDQCGAFNKGPHGTKHDGDYHLLNFADTQPYLLTKEGPSSPFFLKLIDKVTNQTDENPFYVSWRQDQQNNITSAAHYNYFLLQQKEVKESIVQSLIEVMIKKKVFISTRAFYNFLYEIIMPVKNEIGSDDSVISVNEMLPNLMYGHPDRSPLLAALNEIDPLKRRMELTDLLVSNFMLTADPKRYVKEELGERTSIGAWKQVQNMHEDGLQAEYARLLIRQHALLYRKDYDQAYQEFLNYIYSFYVGEEDEIGDLFELIEKVIYTWKGSPKDGYIFVDSPSKKFRMAVGITISPEVDGNVFGSQCQVEEVERFTPSVRLGFSQKGETFLFELDYKLYFLLKQIDEGYRPNRQDVQDALQFSKFHDGILKTVDKKNKVLLVHGREGTILEVRKPRFSSAKFEVGKVN